MSLPSWSYRYYFYSRDAVKIFLLLPLNGIFSLILWLWWRISGVQTTIDRNRDDPGCYDHSAQLLKCWGSVRVISPFPRRLHFLLTHESFCHPSYVLKYDVTLLDITEKEAIFVETDRRYVPVTKSKYVGMALGQLQTITTRLVILPRRSFMKLADGLLQKGLPRVCFIHNHSRCGSTLLCRLLEQTGQVMCLCEPEALSSVFLEITKVVDRDARERMLHAVVAMLIKPTVNESRQAPSVYVIKPRGNLADRLDIFLEVFPKCVHYFLYRNPICSSKSTYRVMSLSLMLQILKNLFDLGSNSISQKLALAFGPTSRYNLSKTLARNLIEFTFLRTLESFLLYKDCVEQGMQVTGICYGDLCEHPKIVLSHIFQTCNLPLSLLSNAKRAMHTDAQSDSFLSRFWIARASGRAPDFSAEFMRSAEAICKEHGLDVTERWSSMRLPGSIECQETKTESDCR